MSKQFIPQFETLLLAMLIRNPDFCSEYHSLVKEIYFENQPRRDIFRLGMKYYQKYQTQITREILSIEIEKFLEPKLMKLREEDDRQNLRQIYDNETNAIWTSELKGDEFCSEELTEFVQRQELKILALDIADRNAKNQSMDKILSIVFDRTKEIQSTSSDMTLNLPTFNDIDETQKTDWLVEDFIPAKAITVFYGRGGLGKSHLAYLIGKCVEEGQPFFGHETKKQPVYYIDFENPPAVLGHLKRACGSSNVKVWTLNNPMGPPPRFDSKSWEVYKKLPPGLLIIDTFRAAQESNTNDDKDMTIIMNRIKELWAHSGHTILLLLHTLKADKKMWKGNTVIMDLSDHSLALFQVQEIGETEEEDIWSLNQTKLLYFGTEIGEKSRFEKSAMYLWFDPNNESGECFRKASDPRTEKLKWIYSEFEGWIKSKTEELGRPPEPTEYPNQKAFQELIVKWTGVGKLSVLNLIKRGERQKFWTKDDTGKGKSSYYFPLKKKN